LLGELAKTHGGAQYGLVLVDDYTKFGWIFFLQAKSDASKVIQKWIKRVERESGRDLSIFRSDKGGEFSSTELDEFFTERGIEHQWASTATPEQNGVAERMVRTLKEHTLANLAHATLPEIWWAESMHYTCYIRNRLSSQSLPGHMSPYERWYGKVPNLAMAKTWGCMAQIHIPKQKRKGLEAKTQWGMMIGIPDGIKGWKFYLPETNTFTDSASALFHEGMTMEQWKQRKAGKVGFDPLPRLWMEELEDEEISGEDPIKEYREEETNPIPLLEDENGEMAHEGQDALP
jgi:hypothetical protein